MPKRPTAYETLYERYLGTAYWRAKSKEAIACANFLCQRCYKRPATQSHHLTYDRVGNELLTDLLPVCAPCHRALHPKAANDNEPELPFPIAVNDE